MGDRAGRLGGGSLRRRSRAAHAETRRLSAHPGACAPSRGMDRQGRADDLACRALRIQGAAMFRAFVPAIALVGASCRCGRARRAQSDYPNRVVKIVVPYRRRQRARHPRPRARRTGLSNRLGQQFIVENRTGGSGAIGTASVARADAGRLHAAVRAGAGAVGAAAGARRRRPATSRTRSCRCARPSSTPWGSRCGRIRRSRRRRSGGGGEAEARRS